MIQTILVSGGTGFIGGYTMVVLQQAGHRILSLDNLCNSSVAVLNAIGIQPDFTQGDVRDATTLATLFGTSKIAVVLHFADLKAVGESTQKPLAYYDNNVHGSVRLLNAMQQAGIKTFVFSSSATVYGDPQKLPLAESYPRSATNPYGHTKLVVEDALESMYQSEGNWRIARLRYFNPVGANVSELIGESPHGVLNNLMPYVAPVATGRRPKVQVYDSDHNTPDSIGVRDYIYVMDLAQGHLLALRHCREAKQELVMVNLDKDKSVPDMIHAFELVSVSLYPATWWRAVSAILLLAGSILSLSMKSWVDVPRQIFKRCVVTFCTGKWQEAENCWAYG